MSNLSLDMSISPEKNLSRYLNEIRKFPMLRLEDEQDLSRRWRDSEDIDAANKLVTSHLRLVAKMAMGYKGYGLPLGELVAEGNIGMMKAVKHFNPDLGFRISTYARWWIRASIQEYILHSWSLVKIGTTAAQKKLFFNLRKVKSQLNAIDEGDMTPEHISEIALRLNVSETEVVNMDRRIYASDASLNAPICDDKGGEWIEWLADNSANQEKILGNNEEHNNRLDILGGAMARLSAREREIISERRLNETPITLNTLSIRYGISRERVRQIEVRAFEKLRKMVRSTTMNRCMA